jgi:alpha-glucosidase (family GH31 glycosyl hydrolase)
MPPIDSQIITGATQVRVQHLAENAVRITHAAAGATSFPADRPWLKDVLLATQSLAPDSARLAVTMPGGCVCISDRDGHVIFSEARPPHLAQARQHHSVSVHVAALAIEPDFSRVTDGVSLTVSIAAGEGFYGWGEWFNAFRRESGKVKLKIRDAMPLIQHRETYSGIPIFLSSRGYAFWLLNSHESSWSISPERGVLEIEAAGPGADYIVVAGPAYRDIIQTYTQLTGRPALVPRWALGLMVTGYPQETQGVVVGRVAEHRRRRIPLDAVILDYHWEERYHNFKWRRSIIPEPDQLIAELKSHGVRLGLILTPFVNNKNRAGQRLFLDTMAANRPPEAKRDDERDLQGYEEAKGRGYLAHENAKWWFGQGGMIDFSRPDAADWWNARMRPLYDQGVAFFKNDDGEYLPADGRSALGLTGREYHNLYGFYYGRAIYEGMAAIDRRRPFIYARSVWAGSQRYPAIFLGDQKPTFAHMQSALRCGLNLGLLGFAHWTADVFGLDGKTTPETHMRYAQWALLAPIARYFWRPPAADDTRFPWSHSEAVEANFRAYAELRYRLLPYYYALAWAAYQTGLPTVRPLMLEFQADPRLGDIDDQTLLGDRLMMAPVTEPGATTRRIILPEGTWHDFWSTESHLGGGEIEYAAPLDRLPLLVRGGTILPTGPILQSIADGHRFDQLELHLWPPYPAEGVLFDDDGETRAYEQGAYSVTRFLAEGDAGRLIVHIRAAEGGFPEQAATRQVGLVLHRARAPRRVTVNEQDLAMAVAVRPPDDGLAVGPFACPVAARTTVEIAF